MFIGICGCPYPYRASYIHDVHLDGAFEMSNITYFLQRSESAVRSITVENTTDSIQDIYA